MFVAFAPNLFLQKFWDRGCVDGEGEEIFLCGGFLKFPERVDNQCFVKNRVAIDGCHVGTMKFPLAILRQLSKVQ